MKKENKFIPLYNDLMFKHIFGTEENIQFTKELLKVMLGLTDDELEDMKIVNNEELTPEVIKNKDFDPEIQIELKNNDMYIIKMINEYTEDNEKKHTLCIVKIPNSYFKN